MARTTSSGNFLSRSSSPVSAYPYTISFWFRPSALEVSVMYTLDDGTVDQQLYVWMNSSGIVSYKSSGVAGEASTTNSASAGAWTHACAIGTSATDRRIVLNGNWASSGTHTTSSTPTGMNHEEFGARTNGGPNIFNGDIAELAHWNVALEQSEVEALNKRFSPLLVRPSSLVAYRPVFGRTSPEIDIVGRLELTATGTPPVAAHAPILNRMGWRAGMSTGAVITGTAGILERGF